MPPILAQHTVEAASPPDAAWALWTEAAQWTRFYPDLRQARLPSGFRPGGTLVLEGLHGRGTQTYALGAVDGGRSFQLLRRLPFADLVLLHRVDPAPLGCRLHLRVEVKGPLAWLYGRALRGAWRAFLPPLLRGLAREAQRG